MRKLILLLIVLNGCDKNLSLKNKGAPVKRSKIFINENNIAKHKGANRYFDMNQITTGFESMSEEQSVMLYNLVGEEEVLIDKNNKEVHINNAGSYKVVYSQDNEEEIKHFIISPNQSKKI